MGWKWNRGFCGMVMDVRLEVEDGGMGGVVSLYDILSFQKVSLDNITC
ncbi:hypothetical protein HanIR_Chr05g0252021 [Helianthus annuus]|nr:hypothetical protein HanIR_Chr05g0252021 [Helianthus annuus]